MIGGIGNPYFIPKCDFLGKEKCIVMDYARLQTVQGPKLAKRTCNLYYRSLPIITAPYSHIQQPQSCLEVHKCSRLVVLPVHP